MGVVGWHSVRVPGGLTDASIEIARDVAISLKGHGATQVYLLQVGDDTLRSGPEKAETGEKASLRRRLQTQVESSSLSNFNGPQKRDIVPDELPVVNKPKLRTDSGNALPMSTVEPALPNP